MRTEAQYTKIICNTPISDLNCKNAIPDAPIQSLIDALEHSIRMAEKGKYTKVAAELRRRYREGDDPEAAAEIPKFEDAKIMGPHDNNSNVSPSKPENTPFEITDEQIAHSLVHADESGKDYLANCLIAGAVLSAAKKATPHGQWEKRIDKIIKNDKCVVFEKNIRSAQRYMKLWRAFVIDLEEGRIQVTKDKALKISEENLLAIPETGKLDARVKSAFRIWLGEEGSIRGILHRLGRAEREASDEENEDAKDPQAACSTPTPSIQTTFEDTLFDQRHGLLTKLRTTLQADVYTTLPKSEWQKAFGQIEPLYQLLKERSGF